MSDLNPAYLEWRLSGGNDNANPAASLGGPMSGQPIRSVQLMPVDPVPGVAFLDCHGVATGVGMLDYQAEPPALVWTPPHAEPGATVLLNSDGRWLIPGSSGYLAIDITLADLPANDRRVVLTVQPLANQLWDDIPAAVSQSGAVQYRCTYLCNTHPSQSFADIRLWISQQPSGADHLALALDQAGMGDGRVTGVAGWIDAPTTPPESALDFTEPTNITSALVLGALGPGQVLAVWHRRTIPSLILTSRPWDASELRVSITY